VASILATGIQLDHEEKNIWTLLNSKLGKFRAANITHNANRWIDRREMDDLLHRRTPLTMRWPRFNRDALLQNLQFQRWLNVIFIFWKDIFCFFLLKCLNWLTIISWLWFSFKCLTIKVVVVFENVAVAIYPSHSTNISWSNFTHPSFSTFPPTFSKMATNVIVIFNWMTVTKLFSINWGNFSTKYLCC